MKRSQGISVTFDPEELETLRMLSKAKGVTVSKYVRTKVLAHNNVQELKEARIDENAVKKLREASHMIFQIFKGENKDRNTSNKLLNDTIALIKQVRSGE